MLCRTIEASMSISLQKDGESMSILLIGQDDLKQRYLRGPSEQKLTGWFASVEERAWRYVNADPLERPDEIFLVTGQTLASEFAISHVESASASCEISFEAAAGVTNMANASFLVSRDVRSISASRGFLVVKKQLGRNDKSQLFSIFLEMKYSKPMKTIRRKGRLVARLQNVFTYYSIR